MSEDIYLLPRNESERRRLESQHAFFKSVIFGGRHFYDSSYDVPVAAKILDSGTGTGVWLLDAAPSLPRSVQLYGTDNSTSQFPQSVPRNIQFSRHSTIALPPDWTDNFYFVHQRLMASSFRASEWPAVISELYRVLLPGIGRLELTECTGFLLASTPAQRKLSTLARDRFTKSGLNPEQAFELPALLLSAGFTGVRVHVHHLPAGKWAGEVGKQAMAVILSVTKGFAQQICRETPHLLAPEDYEQTMEQIERELDELPGTYYQMHVIEARKPASPLPSQ